MYDNVISGLVRRRRELTGDILELLAKVDTLAADVDALDRVLRQFKPDIDLDAIPALQHRPKPEWAPQGAIVRAVYDALREAGEPLTTRALAGAVGDRMGLGVAITPQHMKRVRKCLDRQKARGTIAPISVNGVMCWAAC